MAHYAKRFFGSINEIEVVNYISGLSTPLSSAQIDRLNIFVKALKTGLGITLLSDYFDVMYILAGETQESSLRNLVKNAHYATNPGNLSFTQFEGITGGTNIINTNYNLLTQSVRLTQNSSSAGFYSRTGGIGGVSIEMGALNSAPYFLFQTCFQSTKCYVEMSNDVGLGFANTSRLGFFSASRLSSANYKVYKNGTALGTETKTSGTLKNSNLYLLGIVGNYSNIQMSFAFAGKGLTDSEMTILTNTIEAYMYSNGKGVI